MRRNLLLLTAVPLLHGCGGGGSVGGDPVAAPAPTPAPLPAPAPAPASTPTPGLAADPGRAMLAFATLPGELDGVAICSSGA